eukprot:559261-Pelagomonas_calceolata.AAC.3
MNETSEPRVKKYDFKVGPRKFLPAGIGGQDRIAAGARHMRHTAGSCRNVFTQVPLGFWFQRILQVEGGTRSAVHMMLTVQ